MAANMSQAIIGKKIDGIWHTGLLVYGKEYYFGGGICSDPIGRTPYGSPLRKINIGSTELPEELFLDFLDSIKGKFSMEKYDILKNNCNNFTDDCAEFLTGKKIPSYITGLPNEVMSTPMGGMIMNMMTNAQNQATQNSSPIFHPSQVEGSNNQSAMFQNQNQGISSSNNNNGTNNNTIGEISGNDNFQNAIKSNQAVVIDVYTTWCGPCIQIKPFFATLPSKYPNIKFFKMDQDTNDQLGTTLGIQSIPTFLFYNNGNLVKKMSGANQSTLTQNIQTLFGSQINSGNSQVKPSTINQPQQHTQPKGYQVYKKEGNKCYFEGNSYDIPLKKIKEFGQKKDLFKDDYKSQEQSLSNQKYDKWESEEEKEKFINYVMDSVPLKDCDNVLPSIDFLRLAAQVENLSAVMCTKKGEDLLMKLLDMYFFECTFDKDQNPKAPRIIIWRFITNQLKYQTGQKLITLVSEKINQTILKILEEFSVDKNLVNAVVMAMNNFFVTEVLFCFYN